MEDKDNKDKNFEKAALLVAVLLGMTYKTYEELAAVPQDLEKVVVKIHENKSLLDKTDSDKAIKTKTLEKEAVKAVEVKSRYMKILTADDESVCEHCKPWQGKIICVDGSDPEYPSLDDYIRSGAFHIGCLCSLQEISTLEIPRKPPNPRAMNSLCFSLDVKKLVLN